MQYIQTEFSNRIDDVYDTTDYNTLNMSDVNFLPMIQIRHQGMSEEDYEKFEIYDDDLDIDYNAGSLWDGAPIISYEKLSKYI